MEMNTRLQVEHPVTEMITGHDLVEWQLRVASGEALPVTQEQLSITGHAIEARIYAENPDKGFLPSIGTLTTLNFRAHVTFQNGDIRVDGGVQAGDTITPFYDPMIAKLIVRGADRDQARARMAQALGEIQSVGVQTNIAFLRRLMLDPAFASADLDTGLIERQHDSLFPPVTAANDNTLALAVAALLAKQGLTHSVIRKNTVHVDPWAQADGWRLNGRYQQVFSLLDQGDLHELHIARDGEKWAYMRNGQTQAFEWKAEAVSARQYRIRIRLGDTDAQANVVVQQENVHVFTDGSVQVLQVHDAVAHSQDDSSEHQGGLTAPMPGKIIAISVKAGDTVKSGDVLLVMEAMKMEHAIHAPSDGTVEELFFSVGDQVSDGAELISITVTEVA
jgi:3-methylcrotonyl-CoA carboxylase alpha subunit